MVSQSNPAAILEPPSDSENLAEAIQLLHSLATSAVDIARCVRIEQASVLYVVKYGRLPVRQMTLNFGWEA